MFDSKLYWKNRKESKRGQGQIEIIFTPKGVPLKYKDGEDEKEYPNSGGNHMSYTSKGAMIATNRKDSRRKNIDHDYTKVKVESKFKGHIQKKPKFKLPFPASLTNNQRMKLREMGRIDKSNNKKELVAT